MRITVRVPATSANLGPGFDTFGLAFDLCNEVTIDTESPPGVSWEGEGAEELPTDGSDLVSTTVATIARRAQVALPSMGIHGLNRIPLERGLGSSSAAAVAGSVIAAHVLGLAPASGLNPTEIFADAASIEGHPDNAAPATFGGFTIALPGGGSVIRRDPHPDLRPALLIPSEVRLPTAEARQALDPSVARTDAVFNVSRAALLVEAIVYGRMEHLMLGVQDRLHQAVRLASVPRVREVFDMVREAQIPVCVSGAGPSLLAFEIDGRSTPDPGQGWTVLRPGIRKTGFEVSVEG